MKNESAFARKLVTLLKKVRAAHAPARGDGEAPAPQPLEPVTQLVAGFLEWNATRKLAQDAHARIQAVMVDNNDLRVSHPHEVVELLGPRYPLAEERAARLHESLQEIFVRQHSVSLADLAGKSRKQVRTYLDTLPGMVPYVSAQVGLLCFAAHGVPVDDALAELLRHEQAADPDASVEDLEAFLERQIKPEEALETHLALKAWSDAQFQQFSRAHEEPPGKPKGAGKGGRKSGR